MRTLLRIHILLACASVLLSEAPHGAHSSLVGVMDSFDGWVQHVQDTCHPDPDEDADDDDHLPSRPQQFTDEIFGKLLKLKKNSTLYKEANKYGKKVLNWGEKILHVRHLEEAEGMAAISRRADENFKSDLRRRWYISVRRYRLCRMQRRPRCGKYVGFSEYERAYARRSITPTPHRPAVRPSSPRSSSKPKSPASIRKPPGKPVVRHVPSSSLPPKPIPASMPDPPPGTMPSSSPGIRNDDKVIVVSKDGSGDFMSVQRAIDSVPKENKQRVIIYVKRGVYREKVLIPSSKPFITLKGENSAITYIEWNDTASTLGEDKDPLGTFGSASVTVKADDFIALDISFKNTAPAPENGAVGKQAVAFLIQGDRAAFYRCSFYGAQDTLYDKMGRHYYYKCYIEGSIDFIFGNGRSLFVKCHMHSIASPFGAVTAQKRLSPDENTGYSFAYSMLTGSGTIYLGRAWGAYSRVVYSYTYFDDIIRPGGWNDWEIAANQKKVFYGEYKCFGPGANRTDRVLWARELTPAQARPFLSIAFIDGKQWLPK
ncbi:hypothetical protein KP509_13G038200 [Ceratopteris richardii]|uniref:Pectinesterase n=1 Tax=Ceratopteris richardii TaxID=49495 RepID=A0A8T2TCT5_CERRI|nr:hypothetical protein KP509_13G038200 [Ceratopteris richardii]